MNLKRTSTLILAISAFVVCYAGTIAALAELWTTSYVYSYGLVVILISAYILWTRLSLLRTLEAEPDYLLGAPLTLIGIGLLATGRFGLLLSVQEASMIVTAAGLVLMLFGRRAFGIAWFPLGYPLLAIPIWDRAISWLQPVSQDLSARIASVLMKTGDIPVLREGTRLVLPNVTLEVMRECSGVNQLLAIVVMALPAAYLLLRSRVRQAILVVLAVFTAYLSNGVRIALVGFLSYRGLSNGDLRGVHLFEGLAVSLLGYAMLFGCLSLLTKGDRAPDAVQAGSLVASGNRRGRLAWVELTTLTLMLVIGLSPRLFEPSDIRLRADLRTFPGRIGDWALDPTPQPAGVRFPAIDDELVHAYPSDSGERHFLAIDDELTRTYRDSTGQRVRLYIGYHRAQREGKELVGEAGHALDAASTRVALEFGSKAVEIGQVMESASNQARGVLYWYDFNGRVSSNLYLAKEYLVWDALTRRRTNGAVVMVGWESQTGIDSSISRARALAFAQRVFPLLSQFMPS